MPSRAKNLRDQIREKLSFEGIRVTGEAVRIRTIFYTFSHLFSALNSDRSKLVLTVNHLPLSIRLYPPVWFLTMACGQWVLIRNTPSPWDPSLPWQLGGTWLITAGLLLFLTAALSFRQHRTTLLPFEDTTDRLIDSGVFRFSRNPIYLAEAIILIGIALRNGHLWSGVAVPVFVMGINWSVIAWEEQTLRNRFGSQYEAYCRRTRRWF